MENKNKYILLMTILPWLSIPFIGLKSFKRFLPGALFTSLYLIIEGIVAEKKKWWWFHHNVKPNALGVLPLIVGPFFVGTLWILKTTFGRFKLYMIINMIVDAIFTYFGMSWFKKIGYVSLVRLTKHQFFLLFMMKPILVYAFQYSVRHR